MTVRHRLGPTKNPLPPKRHPRTQLPGHPLLHDKFSPGVLSASLRAMPIAITWSSLKDQSILYANTAFTQIFGYQPNTFATIAEWVEATYPFADDRALAWEGWSVALTATSEHTIQPMEIRILCSNGTIKNILHGGVILPDAGWGLATFVDLSTARRDRPSPMIHLQAAREVDSASALLPPLSGFPLGQPSQSNPWELLVAERKRQAEELRRTAELLDRTGHLAGVGGWEVDLVNNTVSWTEETHRIHAVPSGYKPTLEGGLAFYASESRHLIRNALEDAIGSGIAWDVEAPLIRADGQRIWVRTKGFVEYDQGQPIRLFGAIQDITARITEKNALQQANERLILATQGGQIGIYDWDIVSNTSVWDERTYLLFGLDPTFTNASYDTWRERLHPDDSERAIATVTHAVENGLPYEDEYRVLWPDLSVHHLRSKGQLTVNDQGVPIRFSGVKWDVTEQRRLAIERAEQDQLFRITLESIGDGVITTDAHTCVRWMNSVAERLTGWTAAEAAGLPLANIFLLIHEETRERVPDPLAECLARGEAMALSPNTLLLARDGREIGIDDSAAPIRDIHGSILGVVLVFHDVTEQRRLAREAQRVLKLDLQMKDDFLSHVSHELRSPLASIYSFASILADGIAGETSPEQNEYLEIILRNSRQLRSMIEDLLEVSRSETGKLSIQPEPTSLAEAVNDAINTLKVGAAAKKITLTSSCASTLPLAMADPTRIRQVLIILLDNATKFTPPGGSIQLTVTPSTSRKDLLELCVADSGCGIEPEAVERIFEHLYQIDEPGREGRKGLGLGLYIARDLVLRHGGTIWVRSKRGKGSQFRFTLPLAFDLAGTALRPWSGPDRRRATANLP